MEANGSKKILGMKRKTFFIGVIAVCAAALLIEAGLLFHTLLKKKQKPVVYFEPVPYLKKEAPEGYRAVWRVSGILYDSEGQKKTYREYEYDELGRVISEINYYFDPARTTKTIYDWYGKREEEWEADQLNDVKFFDLTGDYLGGFEGGADYLTTDENGVQTLEINGFEPPYHKEKQMVIAYNSDKNSLNYVIYYRGEDGKPIQEANRDLLLDDSGRVLRKTVYPVQEHGDQETLTEYRYEDNLAYKTVYKDGMLDSEEVRDIDTDRVIHDGRERMYGGTEQFTYHYPEGNYSFKFMKYVTAFEGAVKDADGKVVTTYKIDYNEYGQPVKCYDDVRKGSAHNVNISYGYDENGHWNSVYYRYVEYDDTGKYLGKVENTLNLAFDEYGNRIEEWEKGSAGKTYYEWTCIFVPEE